MLNIEKFRFPSERKLTLNARFINPKKVISPFVLLFLLLMVTGVNAQDLADGQAAIEEAATGIEGYFDAIQTITVRLVTL